MTYDWNTKRKKPYSEIGIRRLRCARCGSEARYQWQICADDRLFRPLCAKCDVQLNALVLAWVNHPQGYSKLRKYALAKGVSLDEIADMTQEKQP